MATRGDLARLAAARFAGAQPPLLYLAGEDRARDLAGELAAQGLAVRTVVVYRAAKAARFPPAARTALEQGRIDGVLHFSRRSVESYLDCGRDIDRAGAQARCIIACRRGPPSRCGARAPPHCAWPPRPDEASLLALVTPQRPDRIV